MAIRAREKNGNFTSENPHCGISVATYYVNRYVDWFKVSQTLMHEDEEEEEEEEEEEAFYLANILAFYPAYIMDSTWQIVWRSIW